MGIKEGEFQFNLKKPLKYKFDGGVHEANFVILKEPGMEHIKFYLRLKQMLTKAQMELATKAGKIEESMGEIVKPFTEEIDKIESQSDEIYAMYSISIQASDTVDSWQFQKTFQDMVCTIAKNGICMVDGKLSITKEIYNNLSPDDAEEMALRWCSFFAMPSLEGKKTESGQQPESPTQLTEV